MVVLCPVAAGATGLVQSSGRSALAVAGLAALALTSVFNATQLMNFIVRFSAELEMQMNSVERMLEYADERGEVDVTRARAR